MGQKAASNTVQAYDAQNDTSPYSETDKYQMIGAYCYNTGYVIPDKSQVSRFGTLGESFGRKGPHLRI